MRTGLAEADATKRNLPDFKFAPHQMIKGHAASHNVTTSLSGFYFHFRLIPQSVDGLNFNQRQFIVAARMLGKCPGLVEIAVTLKAFSGNRMSFIYFGR